MKNSTLLATCGLTVLMLMPSCRNKPGSDNDAPGAGPGAPTADGTNPNGGPQLDLQAPGGGVALKVETARFHSARGELQVSLRFANGEGGAPVVLASPQFQLRTGEGLLIMPEQGENPGAASVNAPGNRGRDRSSPDLPEWIVSGDDPQPTYSLAGDSNILLRLRYKPGERSPIAIIFTEVLPQGRDNERRSAESLLVYGECVDCNGRCTYTDVDRNNCGGCGVLADDCVNGQPHRYIFDDVQNCGAQGRACAAVLPDLAEHACSYYTCGGALVTEVPSDQSSRTCRDVCREKDLACVEEFFHGFSSGLRATKKSASGQTNTEYFSCDEDFAMRFGPGERPDLHCGCGEKKLD